MGEIARAEIVKILRAGNPAATSEDIAIYADAYLDYREAQENIVRNGNIVAHPRTGTPIENPYIKVKASAISQLRKITRIRKTATLWDAE